MEVINDDLPCQYALRQTARSLIRPQMTRLVSIESSVLHQLIQLLNCIRIQYPEIIETVGFSYNIKDIYLGIYTLNALTLFVINVVACDSSFKSDIIIN